MKSFPLYLTIGVLAVALGIWFLPGRGIRTRSVRTMQLMQNIFMDLDLLSEEQTRRLVQDISTATDDLAVNRKVAAFLKRSRDPEITNSAKLVASDGLFRDAWGKPLLFAPVSESNDSRLNPKVRKSERGICFLWSSGSNQTNELGFGDDIYLYR
jgi:hypothetical protein